MTFTDKLVYRYRQWRYRERPLPRITLSAGWSLPGWAVRLLAATSMGACVGLAGAHTPLPTPVIWSVVGVLGVWMFLRPRYGVAATGVALSAVLLLGSSQAPFDSLTAWIVLAAYCSVRLAMASALVSWRGSVQVRALFTWQDLFIAGLTALVGLATLINGQGVWVIALGAAALMVLALLLADWDSHRRNTR